MQDLNEEALEVSTTLRIQSILQGNIVFLQIHVLYCLQVDLRVNNITLLLSFFGLDFVYTILNYFQSTFKYQNLILLINHWLCKKMDDMIYLPKSYIDRPLVADLQYRS